VEASPVHASLAAAHLAGDWRGLLIRGASGAGKSALVLALIERGFRLVADDRVILWSSGGAVFGRAPKTLCGLIEVRGLGVEAIGARAFAPIGLIVDLVPAGRIERTPEPDRESLLGVSISRLALASDDVMLAAKCTLALRQAHRII
jgi:serine kinase of HPr protein (carbohydrate metabolism regulator)